MIPAHRVSYPDDRPLDYEDPMGPGPRARLDVARINHFAGEITAAVPPDERPAYMALMETMETDLQREVPADKAVAPFAAAARLASAAVTHREPPDYGRTDLAAGTDIGVLLSYVEAVSARYRPAEMDAEVQKYGGALHGELITASSDGDVRRLLAVHLLLAAISTAA